jgi:peptidyl-prolyl cis-trans isomerase A (cyclophilin A)
MTCNHYPIMAMRLWCCIAMGFHMILLCPTLCFRWFWLILLFLLLSVSTSFAKEPAIVRVRLITTAGAITLALDARRAPATTANFMAYVDDGRFEDTSFYRSARRKTDASMGYIQGGTRTDIRRNLPPVAHEPTSKTGIRHQDATISMARGGDPGTAMGNFFITVGATPFMDASGDYPGYAAFGRVIAGMNVVGRILAEPTGGGVGPMRGQMILRPVRIVRAERLDGVAKPSGRAKSWLNTLPTRSVGHGRP